MALSYVDTDGTLVIPQANAKWTTAPSNSGISTSGVIVLVGESEQGPAYSEEADLTKNFFGPNQLAAVQAKYGSGRLVDAFNLASNPSKDPGVRGSPSNIFLVKSNLGTKAASTMLSAYAVLKAKLAGFPGNLIYYTVSTPTAGKRTITIARSTDNKTETYTFGGNNVLTVTAAGNSNFIVGTSSILSSGLTTVTFGAAAPGDIVTVNGTPFTGVSGAPVGNQFTANAGNNTAASTFCTQVAAAFPGVISATPSTNVATLLSTTGISLTVTVDLTGHETTAQTVAPFLAPFASFPTIGDFVAFLGSQVGWTASTTPAFKQLPLTAIDESSLSLLAATPQSIKKDAYEFVTALAASQLVTIFTVPGTGLPTNTSLPTFLTGGAKGSTTDANILAALAAVEQIRCNAVVTLISQDATLDLAAGLTESGSTYTIASTNAALTDHCSRMSQFKRRRPRQAYGSFRGTYANAKTAAQTQAYFRTSMSFLDYLGLSATTGAVTWFQPYMGAVEAAAMQMAAFYKPIFNKALACSGVVQNAADFQPGDDSQVEDALLAGLLVIRQRQDGAYAFVSDQTTYSADQNFVYNSIQAVYVADTIAMTVAQRMESAFVGQSFADVTASVAMSYLKSIMADLKRLKLIAASDDAVDGYKNAKIQISAPSMLVSAEVKEATGLYFIPISFLITQVQQTATA